MYEVLVDREKDNPYCEFGASFYFETLTEVNNFLDICFKSNKNREYVEIREIKEDEDAGLD